MAKCVGCDGAGRERTLPDEVCSFCHGSGTNGIDLSIDRGREASLRREVAPKLCLKRVANGAWCQKLDGHANERASDAEPAYGPIDAVPAIWRKHRGQQEVKESKPAVKSEPSPDLIK